MAKGTVANQTCSHPKEAPAGASFKGSKKWEIALLKGGASFVTYMSESDTQTLRVELNEFRAEVNVRLHSLETQTAINAVHQDNIYKQLVSIQDNTRWLVRLISGIVVAAIIGFALRGGFNLGQL